MQDLDEIEEEIWSIVKSKRTSFFVHIWIPQEDSTNASEHHQKAEIWTTLLEPIIDSESTTNGKTPLVLLHGLCGSSAIWALNVDSLVTTTSRKVYAIDLLGFGRSSRIQFPTDATAAENLYIDGIEAWRKRVGLEQFILVGHSFGGFLAGCYALKFPHRVEHLVFVDPWGLPHKPEVVEAIFPVKRTLGVRIAEVVAQYVTPMGTVRLAGRFGPWLIRRYRQDLLTPFSRFDKFAEFWCLINAPNPTGETSYLHMMDKIAWAKVPLCSRLQNLPVVMKVLFIYGGKSWLNQCSKDNVKLWMGGNCNVEIHVIDGKGHHVYADDPASFCRIVAQRILQS